MTLPSHLPDPSKLPDGWKIPDLSHHHKVQLQPCSTCGRRWIVQPDGGGFTAEEEGTAEHCCVEMLKHLLGMSR